LPLPGTDPIRPAPSSPICRMSCQIKACKKDHPFKRLHFCGTDCALGNSSAMHPRIQRSLLSPNTNLSWPLPTPA
jgi:hypothetical protein